MQKKLFVLSISLFLLVSSTYAQIEGAYLKSKEFSAFGFGASLNFSFPVTEYGAITADAAAYFFKDDIDQIVMIPLVLGYRYMLQDPEGGFYVEPNAGYNIGYTDIQKEGPDGVLIYDPVTGTFEEQQAKGFTAGMTVGYGFTGKIAFNVGLRYQHVFVSDDPSHNLFSLRFSHPLTFKKKEY